MMNKRIFATLVAMGMVASMGTMAVSATDATGATGTGGIEAIIDKEVIDVTLPTSTAVDTELNFTMDPQTLASSATGAVIQSSNFTSTDKTLFFANANGKYTDTSDPVTLKVFNSEDADLNVKAVVKTANSKLNFSSSADWGAANKNATGDGAEEKKAQAALDEKAHIWLQISSTLTPGGASAGSAGTPVTATFTSTGAELKDSIGKLDLTCFETKYVAASGSGDTLVPAHYEYAAAANKVANQVDIKLTGKTNPNADWDGLASETLNIEYTWSIKKHVDSYLSANTVTTAAPSITATLPEGVTVKSLTLTRTDGSTLALTSKHYTVSGTTYKFASTITSGNVGGTITVTYSNSETETVTIG
jgi:hypothetical protein